VGSGKPPTASAARRWRSAELFGPEQEIEIEHGQAVYRLRLTSLGKLILTK
jgi:hemin uptake protein HemP